MRVCESFDSDQDFGCGFVNHLIQIGTSVQVCESFDSDRDFVQVCESFDSDQDFGAGS